MLSLIKKGSKLENEELKNVIGSKGCGSINSCNNCSTETGNNEANDKSYQKIFWGIFEQP